MSFLENLLWRRSIKGFVEPTEAFPIPDISPILYAISEAPSSFRLQPYKVVVVTNDATKRAITQTMFHHPQISQCTHLLIFCARTDLEDRLEDFVKQTGVSDEYKNTIEESISSLSHPTHWAKHQAYIALGFALAAAAEKRICCCHTDEFSANGVASALDLPHNLVPAVILAIGVHNPERPESPQFRFPESDVVYHYSESTPVAKSKYRHTTPVRKRKDKDDYA